ncbi:MAG: DUF1616 domain-containing protein [Methanolobus sp.]|nr:DUF1616 domain-containing protein [Methanolobus sp.]
MPIPKKPIYTQDLLIILILSFLSIIFILVSPFSETPLRMIFALLLIFFIPGYAFISALFPGNREISGIERFTLSVGFSIVIMVFDGFIISTTEWKFRPDSITISLVLLTLLFLVLTYLTRRRLPEEEQFTFSYHEFISSLNSDDSDCSDIDEKEETEEKGTDADKRFTASKRKKISAIRKKKPCKRADDKKIYGISPEVTRALMIAMVLSIIVAGAMFAYAKATRESETFSALYILGPDGKAENYPETISSSDPARVIAGIHNYEHAETNYILQVKLDNIILQEIEVSLGHNEKWEQELVLTPERFRQGRQKLEFLLHREEVTNFPYRSVHLWLTQVLGSSVIETPGASVVDFVEIVNPDMESDDGWTFVSGNESTVTGSYVNGSGVYSSRAFVINSTFEGNRGQPGFELHYIEQEIHSDRKEDVLLSVYLKDSYKQGTSGKDESQFKRVTLNNQIVWSDGINGDKGWQRLQVPVTLQEGKNTLTFALAQNRNMDTLAVELAIDKVSFIPLSAMSPYLREDNTIEAVPPVSWVDPLPVNVGQNKFTVTWNGTDDDSGIYYYDIDYSTDGINWNRWISRTTTTSAEFEGIEGQTYYFRSKAVDNALNEEMVHRKADASTTIDSTAAQLELDITPNPTSDITYLTLTSSKPLMEVQCLVVPQTFGSSEYVKLTTTDNIKWTAKYTIKLQDTYNVEITAKDFSNNTAYTFGTIYTDTSLEKLTIGISPVKTSGDADITITASTALRDEPTVVVRDRSGNRLDVSFDRLDGNKYIYRATVDDDINDGVARVTATAKTVDSQSLYKEDTFIIDRVKPKINTFNPDSGETVNINNPSIRATFSDDRAGIERTRVTLHVNGEDVTNAADITTSSLYYSASNLDDGEVEVRLSVKDQAGNTVVKTWSFYVSTS